MFVCTGNICRSPLAHRVLERDLSDRGLSDTVSVESSGIGGWHVGEDADARMRRTAGRHGVTLHHPARRLSQRDLERYTLIFAMARGHYRDIRSMIGNPESDGIHVPTERGALYLFRQFDPALGADLPIAAREAEDVPDPYYGGPEGFEDVFAMVERTTATIADHIREGRFS
jgi:protein-tyrosine phosphatase